MSLILLADGWLGGGEVALGFWVCVAVMVIVPSVAYYWHQVRVAQIEANLKSEMVARGYSADEILAVVANKSSSSNDPITEKTPPEKMPV